MQQGHNRINEVLSDYWEALRQGRQCPSESDIDPHAISDIWDSCFLVKVTPSEINGRGYRYAYLGLSLIEAFGDDVTNQEISARLIDPASPPLVRRLDEIAKTGKPANDEEEFVNKRGVRVKYRSCMLPLTSSGDRVDYVIGGMKWKAY